MRKGMVGELMMLDSHEFLARCAESGVPGPNDSRAIIVNLISGLGTSFTAEDVLFVVGNSGLKVSRAAVFRTLDILVRLGMLVQEEPTEFSYHVRA